MTKIKGIDVSEHQGVIDFNRVKKDGIEFVILRSSYGKNTVDKYFNSNVQKAKSAGVKIHGIYHFSYALSVKDAIAEAEFCVKTLKNAGLENDVIVFFDLEYDSVNYAKRHGVTIDRAKCTQFTVNFCNRIRDLGYQPGVYCNLDYYNNMYNSGSLNAYKLWIASWGAEPKMNYDYYQYSSTGKVGGINGNVDMNYFVSRDTTNSLTPSKPTTESKPSTPKISVEEAARGCIEGKYGNGEERKEKIAAIGLSYDEVQTRVNEILQNGNQKTAYAKYQDLSYSGTYTVMATALNSRYIPGVITNDNVVEVLKRGTTVQNYGYYTPVNGKIWLYIQHGDQTGYVLKDYLTK